MLQADLPNRLFSHSGGIPNSDRETSGRQCMTDILVLVLGTGGILLMAAYAALCERI